MAKRFADKKKRTVECGFYPDIPLFLEKLHKTPTGTKAVFLILAITSGLFSVIDFAIQISWEGKVRSWVTVQGKILKHNQKRVRRGKNTRTVSELEYVYTYKKKTYRGNAVAYGEELYPARYKAGAIRPILVNPARPSQSAAMVFYRGYWGLLFRYGKTIFFSAIALGFLTAFLRSFRKKIPVVPEKLKEYMKNFPPEELRTLEKKFTTEGVSLYTLSATGSTYDRKIRKNCMERYWIIGEKVPLWGWFVLLFVIAALIVPCFFAPMVPMVLIFHAILLALLIFTLVFPRKLVLDLHEKRLCFYRIFFPEEPGKKKCLDFSSIEALILIKNSTGKNVNTAWLTARGADGKETVLCHAAPQNMAFFLKDLPRIAKALGNKKILFEIR